MLADVLHKIAEMENTGESRYSPRPSMAGPERCIRQMVYSALGQTPDRTMSGRMLHVLDDSSWHEELTANWIRKSAYKLNSEQMGVNLAGALHWRNPGEWRCRICSDRAGRDVMVPTQAMHGHIDGVITDPMNIDRLWEHKAINRYSFDAMWERKRLPEDYFTQSAIYLGGIQQNINPECRELLLMIKNKDTAALMEFLASYDLKTDALAIISLTRHTGEVIPINETRPDIIKNAIGRFLLVEQYKQRNLLPPRPFDPGDWHCSYCSFGDTCWAGFIDEIESLSTDGQLEAEDETHARFYKELCAQEDEIKTQKEEVRDKLIAKMITRDMKKARAGLYPLSLSAQERQSIKWDEVPDQVQRALDPFRKSSPFVKLYVGKPSQPKADKQKGKGKK